MSGLLLCDGIADCSVLLPLARPSSVRSPHQEYYGYDEKKYPEGMLQRAAGWCKAVQGIRGKILSELSG